MDIQTTVTSIKSRTKYFGTSFFIQEKYFDGSADIDRIINKIWVYWTQTWALDLTDQWFSPGIVVSSTKI